MCGEKSVMCRKVRQIWVDVMDLLASVLLQ